MIARITRGVAISRLFVWPRGLCTWLLVWIRRDRYVLAWELSVTLDTSFCLEALATAFRAGTPAIFNTDQGVQFPSQEYIQRLKEAQVRMSWDGRGRALDNVFVERLWREVAYEEVSIKEYQTELDARTGLQEYFRFYNHERLHQALEYKTPAQVYLR